MRFGCCTSLNNIELVERAGYDYIEPTVFDTLVPEEPEISFNKIRKLTEKAKIIPEAFNVFMPGELKITGETVNFSRLTRYIATATYRANLLGGKILVFGAGGSRKIPDGFSRDNAENQLIDFLTMAGDYAGDNEVIIALEPLNRKETNFINSVPEAVNFTHRVNHPAIKVLADLFHMTQENEPIVNLLTAKNELVHVHISEPGQRLPPGTNKTYDYSPFYTILQQIGYKNRISIECKWQNFERQLEPASVYLKSLLKSA
jgi:sugar phosphate isomerase/epimerase